MTHLPLLTLEQWDRHSVGSEPHRTYDQGPPCQKNTSDSAQCASYEGCPHLKFRIIKAYKSWGTSKTARNTGVKLPAYNKLGFSAVTVLVHPHSPKPMSQPHLIGPLYCQTIQNWWYMRFLTHKIPIVSPGWQHFPGKGRKEVHKEGKQLKDTSADLLFENESVREILK